MPKRKLQKDGDNEEKSSNTFKKQITNGHWTMGLLNAMKDPKLLVNSDELVTVIKDCYPKAERHYLVLPNENISNLKCLNKDHVNLLKHMEKVGKEIATSEENKIRTFKLGYHAEPSMTPLHLHVISDDMNSACIKTKKHWNSFNTDFFVRSEDVLNSLEENGKVILPSKEACRTYMETFLKCHKCEYIPKHIPDLKNHILKHLK